MKETLIRHGGWSFGLLALILAMSGGAEAGRDAIADAFAQPKRSKVVRTNKRGKIPQRVIPRVKSARQAMRARRARNAMRLGGRPARNYRDRCSTETIDMGTWCLGSQLVEIPGEQTGRNDYFFAVKHCGELGGWLPSAGQLLSAADRARLAGNIDDNRLTAAIDEDGTDGLRDRREMSSTLITTTSGGSAAGSQGVTPGSKGNPRAGEPDPVPAPADPAPDTLHYVTVYDNRNRGGFAGGKEVQQPESFRCAFAKVQARRAEEID
jgi:hypothetical protein